ncbi:hypothetical protein HYX16_01600 [Candidatus Woesearchaeota archaeon]|nr:hypothetical protein [Candidatus Woesearchaeota archaeon]
MVSLKEDYEKLCKKYKLPKYEDLDNEFELLYVTKLEEIKFPLRFIRRRINDKIAWFCNMLQTILQPNPGSLISLEESKFFSDNEREKIINLLKDLMFIERESLVLDIESDEKKDVEFVNKVLGKWNSIKKDIIYFSEVLRKGWKEELKKEEKEHYFG